MWLTSRRTRSMSGPRCWCSWSAWSRSCSPAEAWLQPRTRRFPTTSCRCGNIVEMANEAVLNMMAGIMGPKAAREFLPLIVALAFYIFHLEHPRPHSRLPTGNGEPEHHPGTRPGGVPHDPYLGTEGQRSRVSQALHGACLVAGTAVSSLSRSSATSPGPFRFRCACSGTSSAITPPCPCSS